MREIDTKGSMPFAIIAVSLLLASVVIGGVIFRYDETRNDLDSIENDIIAVDDAVASAASYVNNGLGGIVRCIATASEGMSSSCDNLEKRSEAFDRRVSEWLDFQFPLRCGGALVELSEYDISLVTEHSQLSPDSGFSPTYLKGKGSMDVVITSSGCRTETELEISTDGDYALPLSWERLELFRSMAGGNGMSVSQMVSYQLTGLAQYRVMNGYGSLSAYGDRGTMAVLTESDVARAYSYALEAVSKICFRDGSDMLGKGDTDLADALVSENGGISLNLSAVYSQCLMAVIDDIALRWMDYLYGFEILEELNDRLHPFRDSMDSLKAFVFGSESVYSAVPYIEKTLELRGISDGCRYPGSGTTTLSYGDITVSVDNPTGDVFGSGWLKDFGKRYSADTDRVRDFVMDVLKNAARIISENTDLGTVSVDVDPHDGTAFIEALTALFESAIEDVDSAIASALIPSVSSTPFYDPYLGAISEEIRSHSDEFVLKDTLEERLVSAFSAAIPEGSDVTTESMISSGALDRALRSYEIAVRSDLSVFDVLMDEEADGSVVRKVLSAICAFGISLTDITSSIPDMAGTVCDEISSVASMNPAEGMTEIPDGSEFLMDDGSGNITVEHIDAEISGSLIVESVAVKTDSCVHTVGFHENRGAAYTTVFEIRMNDSLDVMLTGSGALAQAMGGCSSVLSDRIDSSYVIEIAVLSGWELAGVDYKPSTTLLDDLWKALLDILEPLIEPLRRIMESVRGAITCISEYLIEALSYVTERLMAVYEAIVDPLGALKEWFETAVEDAFSQAALDILVSIGMDAQTVTFEFFGCALEFSTKAVTWNANTKTLLSATLTMPVSDLTISAGITAKVRGDVKKENLIITGFGSVEGEDWKLKVNLDPLMKGSRYLVSIDGEVRGTDISIVAPKLDNYQELGLTLSDVPGLGDIISNIPLGGMNVGLDAGFTLRYANPQKTGLVVNEFESNPQGTDRGNEYVELYNNSLSQIDLTGYTLMAASDRRNKTMELSGTISPGEHLLIHPDFTLVNSSGKHTKNGEALILKDADGNETDRTPTKKDTADDGYSWQRAFDGSTEWVFAESTPGRSNSHPLEKLVSAEEMKDIAWRAVEKSFDRIGTITDLESLQEFLKYLTRYTLEGVINQVSGQLIEASVFASVDVKDAASTLSAGIKVALRTDGDFVKDVMKYLVGKLMEMVLDSRNPYRIDPIEMFTENIDLELTFRTTAGFPEILSKGTDLPKMDIGAVFRTNLAALTRLADMDTGRPEVMFGLRITDCPSEAIPSKLSPRKNMDHDLWLMAVTVRFPQERRGHSRY